MGNEAGLILSQKWPLGEKGTGTQIQMAAPLYGAE